MWGAGGGSGRRRTSGPNSDSSGEHGLLLCRLLLAGQLHAADEGDCRAQ